MVCSQDRSGVLLFDREGQMLLEILLMRQDQVC